MAAKIVRQLNKIALLGAPTSAAATSPGHEGAPQALRAAGLADRLRSAGYDVNDLGDDPIRTYQPDEESPRARNLRNVVASLESLKPRVEQAIKSGALPLILAGDCSVAVATVAAARRYFRNVGLIYMDRDADFHTPGTTPSGSVDGMVVSHLTGRGAAEMVRFWGEPPLVREPDLALFGTVTAGRVDAAEQEALDRSPLRQFPAEEVKRKGARAAAESAMERIHGGSIEFVVHLDVDVIADFQATNDPGTGGLTLRDIREALMVFVNQKHLAAIEITAFNPAKDANGSGANQIVDLLAEVLGNRLGELKATSETQASAAAPAPPPAANLKPDNEASAIPPQPAPVTAGEAWSSDDLEIPVEPPQPAEPAPEPLGGARDEAANDSGESHS